MTYGPELLLEPVQQIRRKAALKDLPYKRTAGLEHSFGDFQRQFE